MKFFLDENIPKTVEDYLISNNHEVITVRNSEFAGKDDFTLLNSSVKMKAVFVTTDRDFFHTVPFRFPNHTGIVIITLKMPNRDSILEKIKWTLNNLDIENFTNKILLLKDNSYSIK